MELPKRRTQWYNLSGYVTKGEAIRKRIDGKDYEIVRFQGEHENEFCVYELKNEVYDGRAQLFDDGVLKMAWIMKDGKREGHIYLYDKGRLCKESRWNYLESEDEEKWIVNNKDKQVMVISDCKSNRPLYVGGFNDQMEREGYGMEYSDGSMKWSGYWKKDELIHIHQRVLSEDEMIEYGGEKTDNNWNVLDRRPVYRGGFVYDREKNRLLRHGFGCILNEWNGVCIKEGEWNMGVQVETNQVELKNGRYNEGETDESLRMVSSGFVSLPKGENSNIALHFPDGVWNIEPNSYIEKDINEWKIFSLPNLRQLVIGDGCFRFVTQFVLSELNELETVTIKKKCFCTRAKLTYYIQYSIFSISNCQRFRELRLDNDVFYSCETFELCNLPSLLTVSIGNRSFQYACYCKLNGIPSLKKLDIGNNCFKDNYFFELDGYNELESVRIGNKSFTIAPDRWLYYFQCGKYPDARGGFKLTNCSSLKDLHIGDDTFSWYRHISWSNLPSLESISIGNNCFRYVTEFHLVGLDELDTLQIGNNCFIPVTNPFDLTASEFRVSDCPQLCRIEVGQYSFYHFKSFVLKNNPSLSNIQLDDNVSKGCETIIFEGTDDE